MATFQGASANPYFKNSLQSLLQDPTSFTTDPGYLFARDQALQATKRANSRMLGSGNIATALQDRAAGLASQAFDTRVNQLAGIVNGENQYDIGLGSNANTATRNANDLALGTQANANNAGKNAIDLLLGSEANANTAQRNANDLGLGMYRANNDFTLGSQSNANNAQRNYYDFTVGSEQNANQAANNQNQFNLGMFNAQTNRGSAMSGSAFNWQKYYDQLYPRNRIAGGP